MNSVGEVILSCLQSATGGACVALWWMQRKQLQELRARVRELEPKAMATVVFTVELQPGQFLPAPSVGATSKGKGAN